MTLQITPARSSRRDGTEPVGSRPRGRTPEGLDDMAGNVWEWCRDQYAPYSETSQPDPLGPTSGKGRVVRSGSFLVTGNHLRAAYRYWFTPVNRFVFIGFRVVSSRLRS